MGKGRARAARATAQQLCPSVAICGFLRFTNMSSRRTNIILIGFMGSGKSSIGRMVAKRMGFQFVDTDRLIEERAGKSIPETFAEQGEEAFRDLETAAIESLVHFKRCVISTGGGAVLREKNRALLRELGFVVLLTASAEVLWERVSRNTRRPLLQTENPRETLSQMLAARREVYEAAAEFVLDTSHFSHGRSAQEVIVAARRAFSWKTGA
jgi:shikimate kinase